MAATIKVANRMPRAVQIAPGVVLAGAQGAQIGITEGVDAAVFAKWRELSGESINESAIFEMKGDINNNGKAVIAGAGGVADKPSNDAPGVSDPVESDDPLKTPATLAPLAPAATPLSASTSGDASAVAPATLAPAVPPVAPIGKPAVSATTTK